MKNEINEFNSSLSMTSDWAEDGNVYTMSLIELDHEVFSESTEDCVINSLFCATSVVCSCIV